MPIPPLITDSLLKFASKDTDYRKRPMAIEIESQSFHLRGISSIQLPFSLMDGLHHLDWLLWHCRRVDFALRLRPIINAFEGRNIG